MAVNNIVLETEKYCNIHDIKDAKHTINKYIRKTPLIQSMFLSRNITGGNIFLKLENMPVSYTHLTLPTNREV